MNQKIVIKVQVNCQKCRSKAMKIAAMTDGVNKVEMQAEKDELAVIGDGVDSVKLTRSLRKKLKYATLSSVQEVKDNKDDKEKPKPEEEKPTEPYNHQFPSHQFLVYEQKPSNDCFIM